MRLGAGGGGGGIGCAKLIFRSIFGDDKGTLDCFRTSGLGCDPVALGLFSRIWDTYLGIGEAEGARVI